MLIENFDKLTSGRRVRAFTTTAGQVNCGGDGMRVAFYDDNVNADAWVCYGEEGIWLTYNAHHHTPAGYEGNQGVEEPLASIIGIVLYD